MCRLIVLGRMSQPSDGIHSRALRRRGGPGVSSLVDGLPIRCSCSLPRDAHQLRLSFAEERLPAPMAIDPSMTDHDQEILCRKDASLRVGHLIGASGTGNVAGLALTERTGWVGTSTHVKELEAFQPCAVRRSHLRSP